MYADSLYVHVLGFRTGQDPKNFAKENLRRIRKIQVQSKIKEGESSKPVKAVHRSNKYDHVQPKVTLHLQVRYYMYLCILLSKKGGHCLVLSMPLVL